MTEATSSPSPPGASSPSASSPGASGGAVASRSANSGSGDALDNERGSTSIADNVVTKVAGIAAREVGGVHQLGGGVARALGSVTSRIQGADAASQGVSVEVGEREAAVDLTVVIEYGEPVPRITQQIRENVIRRIEGITGLSVTEVNIAVNDLHFADEDDDADVAA